MNSYGAEALRHWRAYLPAGYGRLKNPEEFFTYTNRRGWHHASLRAIASQLGARRQPAAVSPGAV